VEVWLEGWGMKRMKNIKSRKIRGREEGEVVMEWNEKERQIRRKCEREKIEVTIKEEM
jgi:hypothetical protein